MFYVCIKPAHINVGMVLFVCLVPPGLAVGLGIGALAEVAKKTIRHNGAAGTTHTHTCSHNIALNK